VGSAVGAIRQDDLLAAPVLAGGKIDGEF